MSNNTMRVIENRCGRDCVSAELRVANGRYIILRSIAPVPIEAWSALLPPVTVPSRRRGRRRDHKLDMWLRERYCAGATWTEMEKQAAVAFPDLSLNREAIRKRVKRAQWYAELVKQRRAETKPPKPTAAEAPAQTSLVDAVAHHLRRHGPSSLEQLAERIPASSAKVHRVLRGNPDRFRYLPDNRWTLCD